MEMEAATLPRSRRSRRTDAAAKPCSNSTSVQRGAAQQKAKKSCTKGDSAVRKQLWREVV